MVDFYPKDSPVKELKYKDFKYVNNKPVLKHKKFKGKSGMVLVYAPWCKHCKGFTETWNDLAQQYNYIFPMGAINAEDIQNHNHQISSDLSVRAYPTIFHVSKTGRMTKYKLDETRDELMYYISSKI